MTWLVRIAAYLDHGNGVVRPGQRLTVVGRGLDNAGCAERLADLAGYDLGGAQPLRVDVVQADG